jgi:UDP-galactopyranose mutase
VNDQRNNLLYQKYAELAAKEPRTIFGGRLAEYKYYDMDKVIESALMISDKELGKNGEY